MRQVIRLIAGALLSTLIVGTALAQSAGTRLLVLHPIRATVEIPADWIFQSESGGYGNDSGYVVGVPVSAASLAAACDSIESVVQAQIAVERQPITLDGLAGCELRGPEPDPNTGRLGVTVVLQIDPPVIFVDRPTSFVRVAVDADHADAVLASLSFDPSRATASAYMDSLIDWVQTNSYYADQIDWAALRADIAARAVPMTDLAHAQPLIDEVLRALRSVGDRHSRVTPAAQVVQDLGLGTDGTTAPATAANVGGQAISDRVGYVDLRTTLGTTYANYVRAALAIIRDQEAAAPKACWVIDLRGNTGGNMLTMMIGVEPILGEGIIGGFDSRVGGRYFNELDDHALYANDASSATLFPFPADVEPVTLAHPHPPVAVLQSRYTASAGENTLLAFRGRPDTRSFGDPSGGFTVGNTGMTLFDGTSIVLASSASMDRNGNVFTGPIPPDVEVPTNYRSLNPLPPSMDAGLQTALAWLREDYGCE